MAFVLVEEHPLHDVLELSHVAVEREALQMRKQIGIHRGDAVMEVGVPARELQHQRGQIFAALAQGRQVELDDVQAVKEVGAEGSPPPPSARGSGWPPRLRGLDGHLAVRAQRPDDAALQRVEQLRLEAQRQVVDVVEEERPFVRCLEESASRAGAVLAPENEPLR